MTQATFARDRVLGSARKRRPLGWLGLRLVLAATFALGGVASHAQDELEAWDEFEVEADVVRLRGQDLPAALRLSTFTGYLVAYVEKDVHAAQAHLDLMFGIELSEVELLSLVGIYGDFTLARRQYYEQSKVGLSPEARTALGRSQVIELLQFEGGVLGRWTALLRDNGHDVDQFLSSVVHEPRLAISHAYSGDVPTAAALIGRAKVFETAFRNAHGRSLEQILSRNDSPAGR